MGYQQRPVEEYKVNVYNINHGVSKPMLVQYLSNVQRYKGSWLLRLRCFVILVSFWVDSIKSQGASYLWDLYRKIALLLSENMHGIFDFLVVCVSKQFNLDTMYLNITSPPKTMAVFIQVFNKL